jgi:hypothetical protein
VLFEVRVVLAGISQVKGLGEFRLRRLREAWLAGCIGLHPLRRSRLSGVGGAGLLCKPLLTRAAQEQERNCGSSFQIIQSHVFALRPDNALVDASDGAGDSKSM